MPWLFAHIMNVIAPTCVGISFINFIAMCNLKLVSAAAAMDFVKET